ncbi:T9SS sorting signal type C domain-containing protein [Flavobacterium silvisoli]|uniref:T9SS sorting signal type C domain-containing protein n=1 Tax=Flavobacterium silvisoli TaxID=2529433 RepID=A0A4Q9YTS8_9FLAO|nr:T9SS sorting signal type C domain-containing protein [Flavobacterium silvisoli]TBX67035.1 T9SS sorting signal type C domain-containing protein [Flavobacterium silvisoli]
MKTNTLIQMKSAHYSKMFLLICCAFTMHAANLNAANNTNAKSKYYAETNRVWINATSASGAFSQTLIGYRTGATDGYDHGYDGAFWNDGAIGLASLIGDTRYAIQFKGLPFSSADIVPLSFTATQNGAYTFAIDHMDGFFTNVSFAVYIHDKSNNTYTNLKTSNYTFTSNSGSYNNRFELTYSVDASSALGTVSNPFNAEKLEVYNSNQSVIIKSGNTVLKNIELYNINGQVLYENKEVNAAQVTISNLPATKQAIIIRATSEDGITAVKKWLYY